MILVNKVDGPLKQAGHLAIADYTSATKLIHAGKASWRPPVNYNQIIGSRGVFGRKRQFG